MRTARRPGSAPTWEAGRRPRWTSWLLVVVFSFLTPALAGCWDRREIDDLAFIVLLGIDHLEEGEGYQVTAELPKPQQLARSAEGGRSPGKASLLARARGATISAALAALMADLPRYVFLGHIKALVLGEAVAREGVKPVLDFFARERDFRLRTLLLVTPGRAEEVLALPTDLENWLGTAVVKQFNQRQEVSTIPAKRFYEFMEELSEPGVEPYTAGLAASKEAGSGTFSLESVALFQGDQLVGWLDREESRNFLWILGKSQRSSLLVSDMETGGRATLKILRLVRDLKVETGPGRLVVNLKLRAVARLDELQGTEKLDLPLVERMATSAEGVMRDNLNKTFQRVQREFGSDVFGLGQELRRSHPDQWKKLADRWPQVFREADFRPEVKVIILGAGLSIDPVKSR